MDSKSLLDDLFSDLYEDPSKDVYDNFLGKIQGEGISLGFMIPSDFLKLPKDTKLPLEAILPLKTYSKIITTRYAEEAMGAGSVSWREFISDFFVLCLDEVISLEITHFGRELFKIEDKIENLKIPLSSLLVSGIQPMDIIKLKITLIKPSSTRMVREKFSYLDDSSAFYNYLTSKDLQIKLLKKLPLPILQERLKLFNKSIDLVPEKLSAALSDITPLNFNLKNLLELSCKVSALGRPDLSNEEVLSLKADGVKQSLDSMSSWLLKPEDS